MSKEETREVCVLEAQRGEAFQEGALSLTICPEEVRYGQGIALGDHALTRVVFSGEKA